MKAIYKAIEDAPDEERLLNFEERLEAYIVNNARRERRIFHLTHDGFMFVMQGFTGAEANAWKWKFIAAFRDMERQIIAQREREANALFFLRPAWKPISEHPDMRRGELISLTGHKSPGSITACRRRMRQVGLF